MVDKENITAATTELKALLNSYKKVLPGWSFPVIPLIIAAAFQSIAWMSGPIFLKSFTLIPRILILWLFAAGEYLFMSPTMNIGVEIMGLSEAFLVTIYQVITLVVFIIINIFVFKKKFEKKYYICFLLLALTVYIAYML